MFRHYRVIFRELVISKLLKTNVSYELCDIKQNLTYAIFFFEYPAVSSYTDDRAKMAEKVCSFHLVQGTMERRHVYYKPSAI